VVAELAAGRAPLKGEDRFRADLALAGHARNLGDAAQALAAYDAVLAYQSDQPEGLWGKAAALALAQRWDESFAVYEQVIRLRTGLVALRCDYARDLLRAGRIDRARAQLKEARLLDAQDPTVLALEAWLALIEKDAAGALRQAEAALQQGPWSDLALIIKAAALQSLGQPDAARTVLAPLRRRIAENAPPEYVYRKDPSGWISVHELPAVERSLLAQLTAAP
jgi:tetratricopeptide (TPR) repeat protein